MSAYLTRAERAALSKLPVPARRAVLSERFERDCPNAERTIRGPRLRPGTMLSYEDEYELRRCENARLSEILSLPTPLRPAALEALDAYVEAFFASHAVRFEQLGATLESEVV